MSILRPICSTITSNSTRSFSSTSLASTSKLSPLNKTTLARINKATKGGNSNNLRGKKLKEKDPSVMTLEEAAKVLQVNKKKNYKIEKIEYLTDSF